MLVKKFQILKLKTYLERVHVNNAYSSMVEEPKLCLVTPTDTHEHIHKYIHKHQQIHT